MERALSIAAHFHPASCLKKESHLPPVNETAAPRHGAPSTCGVSVMPATRSSVLNPQSSLKWYSIRARAPVAQGAKSAEILIYGDIGESWYGDSVLAKDFVQELMALDADEITVRINSFGGSVSDGIAIYNAIKRHKAATTVVRDGVAASIPGLIAMAGDTVEMAENALLMIHAPWGLSMGNSADMRDFADYLDTWASAMSTSYAAKTGGTPEDMLSLLTAGEDHWDTADEALAGNF